MRWTNSQWDRCLWGLDGLDIIGVLCRNRLTIAQIAEKLGWSAKSRDAGRKRASRWIASLESKGLPIQSEIAPHEQWGKAGYMAQRYWLDPKWVASYFNLGRSFVLPDKVAEQTVLAPLSPAEQPHHNDTSHLSSKHCEGCDCVREELV